MPESYWVLQECESEADHLEFALELRSDHGVAVQFTGRREEMEGLAAEMGITPIEIEGKTQPALHQKLFRY